MKGKIRIIGSIHESKTPQLWRLNTSERDVTFESGISANELCESKAIGNRDKSKVIPNLLQSFVVLVVFIVMGYNIRYI
jgi:hypothetical protein